MKGKSEGEVAQSCRTLRDPMDCSLPGSSVHGIFQARVLEWGAIAFSIYAEYIIQNARLDEVQAGIKIALAIRGFLYFYTNGEIICSSSVKNNVGNLIGIPLNLVATYSSTLAWKIHGRRSLVG